MIESDEYPTRNNKQYTAIEQFKKYEYSECIAFELSVRTAQSTLVKLIPLKINNGGFLDIDKRKKIKKLEKELEEKYWLKASYFFTAKRKLPTRDKLIAQIKKIKLGMINYQWPLDNLDELSIADITLNDSQIENSTWYLERDSLYYGYHYSFLIDSLPDDYRLSLNVSGDESRLVNTARYGNTATDGNETYEIQSYTDTDEKSERVVTKKKSRPSLIVPKKDENNISLKINPNLPVNENIEFIKKILEDIYARSNSYSKNQLIKMMPNSNKDLDIEAFVRDEKKFNSAKKIADMLFIYDYVYKIIENAKRYNKEIERELSDPSIDKYERELKRSDLSPYITAKAIIHSTDYGNKIAHQLSGKRKKTIEDDYNTINKYIKNTTYKSLI